MHGILKYNTMSLIGEDEYMMDTEIVDYPGVRRRGGQESKEDSGKGYRGRTGKAEQ